MEASKFEELSNHIISFRWDMPMILTGSNSEGKPIPCPIDGVYVVNNNNNTEYYIIEATTTKLESLENKWLNKSDKNLGDVIKVYEWAKEIYKNDKNTSFTLFLMTNRNLCGNEGLKLIKNVYREKFDIPLKIEIMEQGSISSFLDNDEDGQYLREKFLQIRAERLSKHLLHEICEKNLQFYKNFINTTGFDNLIEREEMDSIETHINSNKLSFLIGESGYGKSIISFQILQKHIENGGYGLWISEEFIKDSSNLKHSLNTLLHHYYPKLEKDSGLKALNYNINKDFLIIFDDLNRSENPKKLIDKIIAWSKSIESNNEDNGEIYFNNIKLICPSWQKNINLYDTELHDNSKIIIGKLSSNDGIKLIKKGADEKNIVFSDLEVKNYLKKLDYDPFHVGLFLHL